MDSTSATSARKAATVENSPAAQALALAAKGLQLVPVHTVGPNGCSCRKKDCGNSAGKHPIGKNWPQQATSDRDVILNWWQHGAANFGIATGSASGGVFVLDFDIKTGGLETLVQLRSDQDVAAILEKTFAVRTPGGGWHFYFRYPPGVTYRTRTNVLPGMDVRAEGGMAVGPGSSRPQGAYRQAQAWPVDGLPTPPPQLGEILSGMVSHRKAQESSGKPKEIAITAFVAPVGKKHIDVSQLSTSDRDVIRDIVKSTLPTESGTRHRKVFELARKLRSLPGWWDAHPNDFRDIVHRWHDMAVTQAAELQFSISHNRLETWADFQRAWPRIKQPAEYGWQHAIDDCRLAYADGSGQLPAPVDECVQQLRYQNDAMAVALVLLCWTLQQNDSDGRFFLSCHQAAKGVAAIIEVSPLSSDSKQLYIRLSMLVADGVLTQLSKGQQGKGKQASEYQWTWTPLPTPPPSLDWLS